MFQLNVLRISEDISKNSSEDAPQSASVRSRNKNLSKFDGDEEGGGLNFRNIGNQSAGDRCEQQKRCLLRSDQQKL